jgi:2-haloalkanoic acid dehalogenase type II
MRLELVAFDLYGTLLDVSGLAKRLEPYAGPQASDLLSSWRKAQLERTWREKEYEPFDLVTARALEEVAPRLGAEDRLRMCETWLSLPPFPDARATLESLRKARVRRAVLSNGTPAMIRAALAAADLEVDEVFSADDVRAYKPDPKVYALLRREGTLFVSGNGWDAEGAKRSGLTVAWIDRGTPPPGLAPDFRVHSLGELAAALWREQGVRIVKGTELDPNTAQTPGMTRAAAITHARAGAEKIWAGTVVIHPNAKTGAHHHGPVESVLYVVRGRARMRWGERLEYTAEAGPGDFIYVPPYVPHQEINASREQPLECVVIRSGQEPVVVNLDIAPVEPPEEVRWIDPIHKS